MNPAAVVLTEECVLDAAEDVLRGFGPSKATVADVAKVLGVSHGSVYRHFRTKVALRDSVHELFATTARFHHPLHAAEWADPAIHADLIEVWKLLVRRLAVRP